MELKTLYKVTYGMYIICSKKGDKLNGQLANTVFQVTSEPPTLGISINKKNLTHEFIDESKVFTVSVLGIATPLPFIGRFGFRSGRDFNKLEGVNSKVGQAGAPIVLENAVGYVEARVVKQLDVNTHTIFIGEITGAEILDEKQECMTYSYYQQVKRGTTPSTAPTYIAPAKEVKQ